jgi:hypothetical protein
MGAGNKTGTPIETGFSLVTGKGRAEIEFDPFL